MAQQVRDGLLAAVRRMLRPLVKLLIEQGVTHDEFVAATRDVFVEVAIRNFASDSSSGLTAKAEALTGIDQKQVQEVISKTLVGKNDGGSRASTVERMLLAWHTEPEFVGPYGFPLELPLEDKSPNMPSIAKLIERHGEDSEARLILDELLRVGAVRQVDTGEYRVLRRVYIPEALAPSSLDRFGEIVENFIATVSDNLRNTNEENRRFERFVFADDGVTESDFIKFDEYIKDQGQEFLVRLDDWIVTETLKPEDVGSKNPIATGLGVYHYVVRPEEQRTFKEFLLETGEVTTAKLDQID